MLHSNQKLLTHKLIIKTVFSRNIRFVFATPNNDSLRDIIEAVHGYSVEISFQHISEGFRQLRGQMLDFDQEKKIYLPCFPNKGPKALPVEHAQKISRYFKIIHMGITSDPHENVDSDKSFYQGRVITWKELDQDLLDVKRDITRGVTDTVRKLLHNRTTGYVELFHQPGAGGTTVARRVVIELYQKYPCLLLQTYSQEAVDEIHRVFELTEQPILILVDNIDITEHEQNELFNLVEKRSIPTVFLIVRKSFSKKGDFYMPLRIMDSEEERFITRFSAQYPQFSRIFEQIKNSDQKNNLLTPFYLGLIVYEQEYVSISKYVFERIKGVTEAQRSIILFIAFYSYFAREKDKGMPSFVFNEFLNLNLDYIILQDDPANKPLLDLIVE